MQWTGKPASLKAATFLGAVALLGVVGLLRAVNNLGQDALGKGVLDESSSRVLWQHLDDLDSLLKPVHLAASASQPLASRTKSNSRSSCEAPFVLRIESIGHSLSISAELANAGIDLFKSSGFSNKVEDISHWYQPQLARFLCKDPSVQDWHKRYGNISEYDQLCAARTSSIVRSTWTHAAIDPVFRVSPTLETGWPVFHVGTGTGPGIIVQHEGAIMMRGGLALQGANCCYCEAFLEMHDAESSCACLNEQGSCALAQHQKVFSIAQVFGYGYAHFVKEVLPRLVPFAAFLRANKNIKIHVKTLHDGPPGHFVGDFLGLLGLDPARVIFGDVVAQEAWIPLWTTCGMASAQHSLLLATRDLVWRAAGRDDNDAPLVIIIERRAGTRTWKSLPDRYEALATAVRQGVPAHAGHVIARLRDDNVDLLQCVACQVRLFRRADIVIGMHGAGLSNALFMPSGGLVVELGWPGQQTEYTVLSHVLGHRYVLYDAEKIARDAWTGLTRILAEHFATMGHVGLRT